MMDEMPLVSVLMTAYNRERYIAEAIQSVLTSTYQTWELIIVDDGSKDNTVKIAKSYAAKDGRIKVHINEKNLGDYPNRNKAVGFAQGKYIVFVDSDDWMFKDALVKWVDIMENENASFGIFTEYAEKKMEILKSKDSVIRHFFSKPILASGPIATIIKTDYFKQIKGFPESYGPANDMYYNLKAASNTATVIFPFPLVDYRIHEGQELNNKYSYLYNNYRYLRDALNELNLPLSQDQKKYLHQKNKRRFVTNCCKFLIQTKSISKTKRAIKSAEFGVSDLLSAIFNKNYKVE